MLEMDKKTFKKAYVNKFLEMHGIELKKELINKSMMLWEV